MVTLELSDEEARELHAILESYLSDLRMEIADTDRMDFREGLKRREALMKKVLAALAR